MLSLLTMHVAGLKTLVLACGGTLLLAHIVMASLAITTLIVLASTTSIVMSHAARPVGPAMFCKMAELAIASLLKLVTHLVLCVGSNLFKLITQNKAFAQARVIDLVEVLREHLLVKFMARADVLCPVALVEGCVKLFHRETAAGLLKVTLG
jgi:hypothetical protein